MKKLVILCIVQLLFVIALFCLLSIQNWYDFQIRDVVQSPVAANNLVFAYSADVNHIQSSLGQVPTTTSQTASLQEIRTEIADDEYAVAFRLYVSAVATDNSRGILSDELPPTPILYDQVVVTARVHSRIG